jgi:hypothetical protein
VSKVVFSVHAIKRMFQRGITADGVIETATHGELVEDYPNDTPYPSRLVLGWPRGRAIHAVVAENAADDQLIVVTVYEPDPAEWEPGFKRRKP